MLRIDRLRCRTTALTDRYAVRKQKGPPDGSPFCGAQTGWSML